MNESKNSFTTSFGRTIPFVPGHIEFVKRTIGLKEQEDRDLKDACANNAKGQENLDYKKINAEFKGHKKSLSLKGYASRFSRVYIFMELARNTNIQFPFKKSLDVGCGNAIQPRIMKGLGLVQETAGIDLWDRATIIDERNLMKQHRRLYRFKISEPVYKHFLNIPREKRKEWQKAMLNRMHSPRIATQQYGGWMPDTDYYRQKTVNSFTLDRFIAGNIFELKEKFDCITSFASLEWFEMNSILEKISDLLEVGGIFYVSVPHWWCAVNTTTLAGHFPYACQRLTKEDFFRYIDEFLPEYANAMKVAYGYFDANHPTRSDYINCAFKHGLVPLSYYSHIFPEPFSMKYGIAPRGYFDYDCETIDAVLEDIHCFRPDIRLEDLLCRTNTMIFRKVDKKQKIDQAALESAYHDLKVQSDAINPLVKKAYRMYKRIR